MRFQSVLLVNLYYQESGYGERLNLPPVGLGYISQYLEAENIAHQVVDTGTGSTHKEVLEEIRETRPELVGFSLNSICFPKSYDLIRKVRELFPEVRIIVGGPHVSTRKADILVENAAIDFAVIGEGEIPLALLCKGESLDRIPGLIYRGPNSKVLQNPCIVQPTDDLPFPRYTHFDVKNKYQSGSISIVTSRGCPFKCVFCQQSSLLGKKWRGRSPENVIEEIRYWYDQGFSSIHILDDNFALQKKRVFRIADLLAESSMKGLEISLIGGVRVQDTDRKLLATFQRMGVRYLSFGIESGSDRILDFVGKGITVPDADRAISLAVEMGFLVRLFFIIGFPYETMEDVQKSFDLALRYPIHDVRFFNLIPYEETGIMHWLKENDATLLFPYDEYMSDFKRFQRIPIFDTSVGMSIEEKMKALRMADDIVRQVEQRAFREMEASE